MRRKLKNIITGSLLFFIFSLIAFGADFDDHMMKNDHDTLLIGEIVQADEDQVFIQAVAHIVSAHDLTEGAGERQLRPERVKVVWDERMADFQVGGYVLASLNQEDAFFVVARRIYPIELVTELDWQVWHVETGDRLTSIILSDFVNQEGRYTYRVRDGLVLRHQGDAEVVIYDPHPPTDIQPRDGVGEEGVADESEASEETSLFLIVSITSSLLVAFIVWVVYQKSENK